MHQKYSRENVVAILMLINLERHDGIFFNDLMNELSEQRRQRSVVGGRPFKAPSRATWYNYFALLQAVQPQDAEQANVMHHAVKFCSCNKKNVDIFMRMFNKEEYDCVRSFMIKRGYINEDAGSVGVGAQNTSLFVATAALLAPNVRSLDDHSQLVGTYQVFRPSLSSPGKVVVSAARIEFSADEGITYKEIMHFRNEIYWRRQRFRGTAVSQEGYVYLLTTDDSTKLMQMSVLKPLYAQSSDGGEQKIWTMAGLYNGATSARRRGFFSTGIYLARIHLDKLHNYDVHRWKIGHLQGFGLLERSRVPPSIVKFLHDESDDAKGPAP